MRRRLRIGIIDSGLNLSHPHIGGVAGGVTISQSARDPSYVDQLGHGTAVAALIHARAPEAELFAIKIFHHALVTSLANVLNAIDWCVCQDLDLINLSLGTSNRQHCGAFEEAIARVHSAGKIIVSAYSVNGVPALPGCLPKVVAVAADYSKSPGEYGVEIHADKTVLTACPYPRDIPGVPRERNLHGVSFAVANITATIASLAESSSSVADAEQFLADQLCGGDRAAAETHAP